METSNSSYRVYRVGVGLSHSLGKLIEWKHSSLLKEVNQRLLSHSLGELIEWKPVWYFLLSSMRMLSGLSHSLGKLIEWKRKQSDKVISFSFDFPTRWEN